MTGAYLRIATGFAVLFTWAATASAQLSLPELVEAFTEQRSVLDDLECRFAITFIDDLTGRVEVSSAVLTRSNGDQQTAWQRVRPFKDGKTRTIIHQAIFFEDRAAWLTQHEDGSAFGNVHLQTGLSDAAPEVRSEYRHRRHIYVPPDPIQAALGGLGRDLAAFLEKSLTDGRSEQWEISEAGTRITLTYTPAADEPNVPTVKYMVALDPARVLVCEAFDAEGKLTDRIECRYEDRDDRLAGVPLEMYRLATRIGADGPSRDRIEVRREVIEPLDPPVPLNLDRLDLAPNDLVFVGPDRQLHRYVDGLLVSEDDYLALSRRVSFVHGPEAKPPATRPWFIIAIGVCISLVVLGALHWFKKAPCASDKP